MGKSRNRRSRLKPQQIRDWVIKNFPEYKIKSGGRQIAINNPFDGDSKRHLWISLEITKSKHSGLEDYFVHDWRTSDYNMTFLSFVKRYRNVSFFEALKEVTGQHNASLKSMLQSSRDKLQDEEIQEVDRQIELPSVAKPFEGSIEKVGEMALSYLRSRMIDLSLAQKHGLLYTPDSIIFPYIEYGSVVYWQERSFLQKSFNFPDERKTGLSKTDFLFNFDNVDQPGDTVIIVEAIINSINVGDGCVATGGAVIGEDSMQVRKIAALDPKLVVLAPDADSAGIRSVLTNYMILRKVLDNCRFACCIPPNKGEDWNDIERRHGMGVAREYILRNTCALDLSVALRLRGRY